MAQESKIEEYLRKQVRTRGGRAYKFISPGNSGVPDRLVCLPYGTAVFVELKAPGRKLTPLQEAKCRELLSLRQRVFVCDTKESVDEFMREVFGEAGV